jgi:hypothetical protein
MSNWTDAIVGERMAVDRDFSERVRESDFSNQEWGLVMTAVEFEIENADDPDSARLVADTSNLPQMMPELENVRSQMGGGSESSGGVVDSIKGALGLGGGGSGDSERLEAAERLVQEYAEELQERLESNGKWDSVRESYDG